MIYVMSAANLRIDLVGNWGRGTFCDRLRWMSVVECCILIWIDITNNLCFSFVNVLCNNVCLTSSRLWVAWLNMRTRSFFVSVTFNLLLVVGEFLGGCFGWWYKNEKFSLWFQSYLFHMYHHCFWPLNLIFIGLFLLVSWKWASLLQKELCGRPMKKRVQKLKLCPHMLN